MDPVEALETMRNGSKAAKPEAALNLLAWYAQGGFTTPEQTAMQRWNQVQECVAILSGVLDEWEPYV